MAMCMKLFNSINIQNACPGSRNVVRRMQMETLGLGTWPFIFRQYYALSPMCKELSLLSFYLISYFLVLSLLYDVPTIDCMRGRSFIVYLNNYLVRKSPHDPRLEYAKQSTDGWWECAPPTPGLSSSSAGHLPQWRHHTSRSLVSNYRWKPVTSGKITHLPGLNEYLPGSWVDNIYYLLDM